MRCPLKLQVAVVERHLIVLASHARAYFFRGGNQLDPHGKCGYLHFASLVEVEHQAESFRYRSSYREQAMIPQDQAAVGAQILDDSMTLIKIECDALVFVDAEAAVELQCYLADGHEAALGYRHGHAGPSVSVNYAGSIMAGQVDGTVDGEAGRVYSMRTVTHLLAIDVDLDQG